MYKIYTYFLGVFSCKSLLYNKKQGASLKPLPVLKPHYTQQKLYDFSLLLPPELRFISDSSIGLAPKSDGRRLLREKPKTSLHKLTTTHDYTIKPNVF
tara:strand:+ start:3547 stop:3840 length:294 start_codon:yes stop_codon:yes gene_type:complete